MTIYMCSSVSQKHRKQHILRWGTKHHWLKTHKENEHKAVNQQIPNPKTVLWSKWMLLFLLRFDLFFLFNCFSVMDWHMSIGVNMGNSQLPNLIPNKGHGRSLARTRPVGALPSRPVRRMEDLLRRTTTCYWKVVWNLIYYMVPNIDKHTTVYNHNRMAKQTVWDARTPAW